jgi:hypothetical protein
MGKTGSYRKKSINSRIAAFLRKEDTPMTAKEISDEMLDVTKYNVYSAYTNGRISKHIHKNDEQARFVDREFGIRHVWEHSDDCFKEAHKARPSENPKGELSYLNPSLHSLQNENAEPKYPPLVFKPSPQFVEKKDNRNGLSWLEAMAFSTTICTTGLLIYAYLFGAWAFAVPIFSILAFVSFLCVYIFGIYAIVKTIRW